MSYPWVTVHACMLWFLRNSPLPEKLYLIIVRYIMYRTVVLYMPVTHGGDFTHMVYLQCFQMHMVCYMLPNLLRQMPSQLKCTAYYIALGYCWHGLHIFFQPGWILFTLLQMINILCLLWLNTKDTMCWLWLSSPSLHLLWSWYRCVWWPQHIQQPSQPSSVLSIS